MVNNARLIVVGKINQLARFFNCSLIVGATHRVFASAFTSTYFFFDRCVHRVETKIAEINFRSIQSSCYPISMKERIYTGAAAKEIDRLAIEEHGIAGFELMSEAGTKAFDLLLKRFPRPAKLLVLCGSGNNGGDGYILASCALRAKWQVDLIATSKPKTVDANTACDQFVADGGKVLQTSSIASDVEYDVVVDALLGVGLNGSPSGNYADLIAIVNNLDAVVFALDVSSGIDADTGAVYSPAVQADVTATFIVSKIGLMTGPATSYVGELHTIELSVPDQAIDAVEPIAAQIETPTLAPRSRDSHKGSYGSVVIAGGDYGMFGAALLAGRSALRSGAGKVTILSTDEHLDQAALHTPELMSAVFEGGNSPSLQYADAIALGPGLGLGSWGRDVFEAVVKLDKTLLIDADGLTHLASRKGAACGGNWVLTPHPGEAARLLDVTTQQVQANRAEAAQKIAARYNAVCVLKGAGTLVASPSGNLSVCTAGNPGMASAGMGDVLSGIIASLLGQGMPIEQAAKTGVWLHAMAADWWVKENCEASLIASDVIDTLSSVIQSIN